MLHRASKATPNLPPALPGTLWWKCAKLLQQAVSAVTKPSPPLPPSKRPRPSSPAPEASYPPPESLREETPLPSSPTLNISSLNQRDALPKQDELEESDIEDDVDIGVEEPKSQDWAVEEKSRDWADLVEEVTKKLA